MIELAIDFETANARRDSACAVGVAPVFSPDIPIFNRLIRPQPAEFSPFCVAVHGIRARDVADAPTFAELWQELGPLLEGATLLAHNASFDAGVLHACLAGAGLKVPPFRFICTVELARAAFPELHSHKLNLVAQHLGIALRHHEAGSDAAACAAIGRHVTDMVGANSVTEAAAKLAANRQSTRRPDRARARLLTPTRKVTGQGFVITGTLAACSRADAGRAIEQAGGRCQPYVTQDTDWLVVGLSPGQTKMDAARARQQRYGRLRMLTEAEFLDMLGISKR